MHLPSHSPWHLIQLNTPLGVLRVSEMNSPHLMNECAMNENDGAHIHPMSIVPPAIDSIAHIYT